VRVGQPEADGHGSGLYPAFWAVKKRNRRLQRSLAPERERELLSESLGHIDRQLELVRRRAGELAKLEEELSETRRRVKRRLREGDAAAEHAASAPSR